jgi:hypothetical protein
LSAMKIAAIGCQRSLRTRKTRGRPPPGYGARCLRPTEMALAARFSSSLGAALGLYGAEDVRPEGFELPTLTTSR